MVSSGANCKVDADHRKETSMSYFERRTKGNDLKSKDKHKSTTTVAKISKNGA